MIGRVEPELDLAAHVEVQTVGELEARDGFVGPARCRSAPGQQLPVLDTVAEPVVERGDREHVGGVDGAPVVQGCGERQTDERTRGGRHGAQLVDLVQVDRADQTEAALPGDDDVCGVLRVREARVRVTRAGAHPARAPSPRRRRRRSATQR